MTPGSSPAAAVEREASQTEFSGLSPERAAKLASKAFPAVIDGPAGGPPSLSAGQRITSFPSDRSAIVDLGEGEHGAIESLEPIAVEAGPGHRVPVDLSLVEASGGFASATSPVDVSIPKQSGDGIGLPGVGVSLTPVDLKGNPLRGSEGVIDGSAVLYANTQTDADTLVKPTATGFQADTLLRSAQSPEALYFKVGMPSGAMLTAATDGSGAAAVVYAGSTLAFIAPPSVRDAAGRQVPVSMTVSGDTLALTVDHRTGQFTYPLDVDPTVVDSPYQTGVYDGYNETWLFYNGSGPQFLGAWEINGIDHRKDAMRLSNKGSGFTAGEWAYFYYITKGASQVYTWHAKTESSTTGMNSDAQMFISSEKGLEGAASVLPRSGTTETTICALAGCAVPGSVESGRGANGAFFEAYAEQSGPDLFTYKATESSVGIVQYASPTASFDTTDQFIEGYNYNAKGEHVWMAGLNPFYAGGLWVSKYTGIMGFEATDPGVGVDRLGWSSPSLSGWGRLSSLYGLVGKCRDGIQCEPCVGAHCSPSEPVTESVWYLPEGEDVIEETALDGVGLSASANKTVKIDNAAPHNIALAGLPTSGEIADGEGAGLKLKATATDGSGAPSSGVASLSLTIDGKSLGAPSGSCSPGTCTATSNEWPLNTDEYGAGTHTLTVTATDAAGNSASGSFSLIIHHASPVSMGPGSVNPLTGAFELDATDATLSGAGTPIAISRSYNSRNLAAGAEGPLGPLWTMSVSGEQSLLKLSTGSVVLTNSHGQSSTFTYSGGKYVSPPGDANLTLKAITYKGAAAFTLGGGGSLTTFAHPTGANESVWMPAITESTGGTSADTFSFQSVEVEGKRITEPTEALAPVPSGVSCSPTLNKGCRALTFDYATSTTATGEGRTEWGDYNGRLRRVNLTAWDPAESAMKTYAIAQYAWDKKGRLRAEWNPRIEQSTDCGGTCPALKSNYGYDLEEHLTALTPPGQESWAMIYGTVAGDPNRGRLLKVVRAPTSTALWGGGSLSNSGVPKLSGTPAVGVRMAVSNGTWSAPPNAPIAYAYQWESCNLEGAECVPILGATNANYTPTETDFGHSLVAQVVATNGGGSAVATSAPSRAGIEEYALGGAPSGIAAGPDGNVWSANLGNSKLAKITPSGSVTEYSIATGGPPCRITTGSDKNLWFTDCTTNKIGKMTTAGTVTQYSLPSGSLPWGIAAGPDEKLWFADTGTSKIGKITTTGTITEYALPAGSEPKGIVQGPDKNLWFTDLKTNKIGKITTVGTVTEYALPAGSSPNSIAAGPDGNLWFTEKGASKIGKITTTGTITEYAVLAKNLEDIAQGSDKSLWFVAHGPEKVGKITTSGTVTLYSLPFGSEVTGIAAGPDENVWFTDATSKKAGKVVLHPGTPTEGELLAPATGTTLEYHVPVSGAGAPYAMGKPEVETWAQSDSPTQATAIFPPDKAQRWPASSYERASLEYFDSHARAVNSAASTGGIATTEYNSNNDVVRTLSPDNRSAALAESGKTVEAAKLLDSESTYSSDGTELLSTLGPQHNVMLPGGTQTQARESTHYFYDEGAPSEGGPYNLVTKKTDSALVSGKEEDLRTTTMSYAGQGNLGWKLRKPTSTATDPRNLNIVHKVIYDSNTGNVIETRNPGGNSETIYPPAFASQFGVEGSGGGQFDKPGGIATDTAGNLWVVDMNNSRVEKFSPSGTLVGAYGTKGSGGLQFNEPYGIAINSTTGNVYVGDKENNRVEVLSSSGAYMTSFGATGAHALKEPQGIAIDSTGNVWVSDTGNNRLEEFTIGGTYLREVGSLGSGEGQLKAPEGLAISEGSIYVVDTGNSRIEQFSPTGTYLGQFGSHGSGSGQFAEPVGIASNPSSGNLYVADTWNGRVEMYSPAGRFLTQWSPWGPTHPLANPVGVTVGASGTLYMTDLEKDKVSSWAPPEAGAAHLNYASQFGSEGFGGGQFKAPVDSAIDGEGNIWVTDYGNDRVQKFSPKGAFIASYGPHVGSGNGEFNQPTGIDINQSTGNVYISDLGNHRIQELSSTGAFIRTFGTEGEGKLAEPMNLAIDSAGNVWVPDLSQDRVAEFSSTGTFIAAYGKEGTGQLQFKHPAAIAVSGENIYVADRANDRVEELTNKGAFVRVISGTEGAGGGELYEPEGLSADAAGNLYVADNGASHVEEFSSTGGYKATFAGNGSGEGQLSGPIGDSIDAAGDLLVVDTNNNRVEKWTAANVAAHDEKTVYYTSGSNEYSECGGHAEWAGLPCQTRPVQQPIARGLSSLAITSFTYNVWDEPGATIETVESPTATRTSTNTYDAAGRALTRSVSSTAGASLPSETNKYSESTGVLIEQATSGGSIKSKFNTLLQLESYTDADGAESTYTYDADERPVTAADGKGTQTYGYDATSGARTSVKDSAAGTFTASYDAEYHMTAEGYPNGMKAEYSFNPAGEATSLEYIKTTHCTSSCTWYSDHVTPSIHGQWRSQASSLSTDEYTYDGAARLIEAKETPAGKGCTTRLYGLDEGTNRTSLITRPPGAEGKCSSEGGTTERHLYDEADRLVDDSVGYDPFGNTTTLPGSDAGGGELTSGYYADDTLATQKQNGETNVYNLDPAGRTRETVSSGTTNATVTSHYAGESDGPSWTVDSAGHWTRDISGLGGLAALQTNGEAPVLQLANLHGDIIATAALSETETKLLSSVDTTEYGVPTATSPPKYSWLGADKRSTETPAVTISMGARSYVPQTGRFLQTDPIEGGSVNAYSYAFGDPVNAADPSGESTGTPPPWAIEAGAEVAEEAVERRAAEEAAARAAAEREIAEEEAASAAYWAYWNNYSANFESEFWAMWNAESAQAGTESGEWLTYSILGGENNPLEHRCPVGQIYIHKKCVQSKPPILYPPPPPSHPSPGKHRRPSMREALEKVPIFPILG
jgi:RHS repeat-associated protein